MVNRHIEEGGLRGLGSDLPFEHHAGGRRETDERAPMSVIEFRDAAIRVMDHKVHWAGPAFAGMVLPEDMIHHFHSEYLTFVKPFPYYLRGVLSRLPPPPAEGEDPYFEIRKDLEENILEEEEGHITADVLGKKYGRPFPPRSHADMFLDIPRDPVFAFDVSTFDSRPLGPKAQAYRDFLEDVSHNRGWEVGAAVITLFVEGSQHEWEVFAGDEQYKNREPHKRAETTSEHNLHIGYGVS
ncbi:MAG: hypothetical protein K2Q26_16015, partial [Bdellovibrionales bacterium]|nr:hypothetical protein [Bdellovibrionales bacterium]